MSARLLALWTVALSISMHHPTFGQSIGAELAYVNNVRGKLLGQLPDMVKARFTLHSPEFIWPVSKNTQHRLFVTLDREATYAFIAACDSDCSHVQLSVVNEKGASLISTPDVSPTVIVTGRLPASGQYAIELSVPGCKSKTCHAGILIARQSHETKQ